MFWAMGVARKRKIDLEAIDLLVELRLGAEKSSNESVSLLVPIGKEPRS